MYTIYYYFSLFNVIDLDNYNVTALSLFYCCSLSYYNSLYSDYKYLFLYFIAFTVYEYLS